MLFPAVPVLGAAVGHRSRGRAVPDSVVGGDSEFGEVLEGDGVSGI